MSSAPVNWEKIAQNPRAASKTWSAARFAFVLNNAENKLNDSTLATLESLRAERFPEELLFGLKLFAGSPGISTNMLPARAGTADAGGSQKAKKVRGATPEPAPSRAKTTKSANPRGAPLKDQRPPFRPKIVEMPVPVPPIDELARGPAVRRWLQAHPGPKIVADFVEQGFHCLLYTSISGKITLYRVHDANNGEDVTERIDEEPCFANIPGCVARGNLTHSGEFIASALMRPRMRADVGMLALAQIFRNVVPYRRVENLTEADLARDGKKVVVIDIEQDEAADPSMADAPPSLSALDLMYKAGFVDPDLSEDGEEEEEKDGADEVPEKIEPLEHSFVYIHRNK